MSITLDSIQRLPNEYSPNGRRQRATARMSANARAQWRLLVARTAAEAEGTLLDKYNAVRAAIRSGAIAGNGEVPCVETVRTLLRRFENGAISAADFRDDLSQRGRTAAPFHDAQVEVVRQVAGQVGLGNLAHLTKLVNAVFTERGLPPLSKYRLTRALRLIGLAALTADRQGSRAAVLDAMPRGTYPTRYTHDAWHLDEGDPRIWSRVFCRWCGQWVSAREQAIIVKDHRSGAWLRVHLADASRRVDPETNCCHTTGFDSDDVLACLLSVARPELAAPGFEELAGYLPGRLRWDNAKAHQKLVTDILNPMALKLAEALELDEEDDESPVEDEELAPMRTEFIPVRRPDLNGSVERAMQTLKDWTVAARGHVDLVIPEDQLKPGLDLGRHRSQVATSTSERQPRLKVVPVMSLPTHDELQEVLHEVGRRYNTEHVSRRHGMPPLFAARKHMPPRARKGTDLVRALPLSTHTVQRDGIVVQRGGVRIEYDSVHNGIPLPPGAPADVYVDPYQRVLWLEQGRYVVTLKPKTERAAEQDPADLAGGMNDFARRASDEAEVRRDRHLDVEYGAGTAAAGKAAYEAARAQPISGGSGIRVRGNGSHPASRAESRSRAARGDDLGHSTPVSAPEDEVVELLPGSLPASSVLPAFDPERLLPDIPDDDF